MVIAAGADPIGQWIRSAPRKAGTVAFVPGATVQQMLYSAVRAGAALIATA